MSSAPYGLCVRKCKGTKCLKRASSFVELALLFFIKKRRTHGLTQ
uniref:Uncharacterized protein n=1 Tax=Siphoviridae sp. ctzXg6 TaxID=2826531 RepID=A0A8S5NE84_9CAUD|nr:MAG TPA: hypothetical protein [Siphoviridae sp. ctzXg6]